MVQRTGRIEPYSSRHLVPMGNSNRKPEGARLFVKANMGFSPYLPNRAGLQENERQRESTRMEALAAESMQLHEERFCRRTERQRQPNAASPLLQGEGYDCRH